MDPIHKNDWQTLEKVQRNVTLTSNVHNTLKQVDLGNIGQPCFDDPKKQDNRGQLLNSIKLKYFI